MKILFLAPQPFFTERGTPIAVRHAVECLARQGHEVELLTFFGGADVAMPGVRHWRIARPPMVTDVPIGFSGAKLICDLWMAVHALGMLRRGDYDVVHAVEEAVFIALALRRLTRVQVVYDVDSILSDQIAETWPRLPIVARMVRAAEHWAFRRSDLVLAVCPSIAERAQATAPDAVVRVLPDVAVAPVHHAGATERLRDHVPDGRLLLLYVGNLEAYQGFDLLLEAQALIPREQRAMLMAIGGTRDAVAAYTDQAERRGVSDHVRFLGPRPLDHLHHYLAQADILCSPRRGGINTPMKIFSYMASGRAILATDIDSHRQVLDTETAMLVSPKPTAIAAGLKTLQRHRALRTALGRAAAKAALQEYGLASFERRLRDAYDGLRVSRPQVHPAAPGLQPSSSINAAPVPPARSATSA